MMMPRRGLRTSVRGGLGLSRTHARTVLLLLVVVGRVAWGWGEPDLNRRIGGTAQRHAPSASFRSCMDVLNSSIPKLDGFFLIDPDGQSGAQRFQVLCRLNSTNGHPGTTVIRTADNANSAVHGNSSITITYDGVQNHDSIRALIDISARCRQYLQYQCKNAPMWLNGTQQVAWVSWGGIYMPNWGGVETGHGRCACSRNASCVGRGHCNCDVLSPHGFYVDAGYITDKDTLPVVGLEFNYHEGYFSTAYYSVGDLECFGRDTAPSTRKPPSTTPTGSILTTDQTTTSANPTTTPEPLTTTEPLTTSASTEPITTDQTTHANPTTTPEPPTATGPLMTSASTEPITTDQTTAANPTTTPEPPTTTGSLMTSASTEPITTDKTTTANPTTTPEPPTATDPLMTSTTTEQVTTSTVSSADDVLQTTLPTTSEVAVTSEVTTAGQLPTEEPAVTSTIPTVHQDEEEFISNIEDELDEWLKTIEVLPGNTPIETLTNASKKILDNTYGLMEMKDKPAILTEMAVTTLLESNLAKIVGGLRPNEMLDMTVGNAVVQAKSFQTSEDFGGYVFKAGQSKKAADQDKDHSEGHGATLEISTGSTEDINGSFSVLVIYTDSSNTSEVANLVADHSSIVTSYVNSGILTCSVLTEGEALEVALKFSLYHKPYLPAGDQNVQRLCSFWNNTRRVWSTEGCKTEASGNTSSYTSCACNHNTSFAILLRVTDSPVTDQENADIATSLLSSILGSLSILCLCMGLALYTYLRLFKFLQIKVHANLMGSLLIGQIIFLTGINATENLILCKIVTVLVQFFFSGTFCWMLIEGGLLFQRARMVSKQQPKILILMLIGWGVPFLITVISFAIGFEDYGREPACWLSTKRGQIWAFVSLVIVVILVNLGILVMVMRTFMSLKMNTDKDNADKIRASFRAMVVLVPILGLTWVFGFLQSTSVAFEYLFVIFNSSQGLLVFICHVVMNSEVQKAFKRRGKNKVSASSGHSSDHSDTQTRKTNTTSATAF
ncbi:uncharacterized protein [Asterias amurensis]|uniref:uncharacterized protein n=1 Tax=Asterias amurensis TaxID=7602 RepID=UPI003AB65AC2